MKFSGPRQPWKTIGMALVAFFAANEPPQPETTRC